jgi:hypothetical protein
MAWSFSPFRKNFDEKKMTTQLERLLASTNLPNPLGIIPQLVYAEISLPFKVFLL